MSTILVRAIALIALFSTTTHAAPNLPVVGKSVGITTSLYGVNLSGGEFGNIGRPYGQGYIYPDLATLQYFAGKGLRLGRLPFKWERVQPVLLGALDAQEVARLHAFLNDANTAGVGIILDMHNYAQYQMPDGSKPHIGEDATLTAAAYQDVWKKLAQEFKNDSALLGYDIMNEPQGFTNPNGRTWYTLAQNAVDAIRTVDTATTIYIEGDCWASAANWSACSGGLNIQDPSNNFIYSAHQYFDANASGNYDNTTYDNQNVTPTTGVDRVTGFVQWLKAKNARGHIGEYGVPNNDARYLTTLQNMLSYLAANCVSGTYWSAGPWWGSYLLSVQPNNGQDQPQMAVLSKFGTNTCAQSTYVAAAPAPTPTPTSAPAGQVIGSSGATVIDITKPSLVSQMSSEATGAAFDWGYVGAGGFLEFKLNVLVAGAYQLVINQASWVGNTGVNVLVNGVAMHNVAFKETGAYTTYANTAPVALNLPAGAVTLRVVAFNQASLNIAGISLIAAPPVSSAAGQTVAATGTTQIDITKPTLVSHMQREANGIAFDWGSVWAGAYVEFQLNVATAGTYQLTINQASWTSGTGVQIFVNGAAATNVSFTPTGNSWTYAKTAPVAIALPAGSVNLRLVASQIAQFNLAGLALTK